MRGIVASLEAAVAFTNAVAGAMPTLTQLLASSSVADVQACKYQYVLHVHLAVDAPLMLPQYNTPGWRCALRTALLRVTRCDV